MNQLIQLPAVPDILSQFRPLCYWGSDTKVLASSPKPNYNKSVSRGLKEPPLLFEESRDSTCNLANRPTAATTDTIWNCDTVGLTFFSASLRISLPCKKKKSHTPRKYHKKIESLVNKRWTDRNFVKSVLSERPLILPPHPVDVLTFGLTSHLLTTFQHVHDKKANYQLHSSSIVTTITLLRDHYATCKHA